MGRWPTPAGCRARQCTLGSMGGCHLCCGERAVVIRPDDRRGLWCLDCGWGWQLGFPGPLIPLTLAFGCLGWASRGDSGPRQRWASGGLLVVAMFSVFSVIWARFGLQTGQHWLWLASLHTALDAATWAAVGAWLR